jgi:hypothetical protein
MTPEELRAHTVAPDPGAEYAGGVHRIDLSKLVPMVAEPGDPTYGKEIADLGDVKIDIAYAGSCTAGKENDLDFYARVLREALEAGRKVAPGVRMVLQYGSESVRDYARAKGSLEVFDKAGVKPPADDWTAQDFREIAKKIAAKRDGSGQPETFGYAWTNRHWGGYVPWIFVNDSNLLTEERAPGGEWLWSTFYANDAAAKGRGGGWRWNASKANDPKNVEALQFLVDMTKEKSAIDPATGGGDACVTTSADAEPGTASWSLPAATGDGYTLLGAPTLIAKLGVSGDAAQVAGRLWDVAPDGATQTLVARGSYRPVGSGTEVWQLHANGWRFAPGHVAKLELLGADVPYSRLSNGLFSVVVQSLDLRLPVREGPGGQVLTPLPAIIPAGQQAVLGERAAAKKKRAARKRRARRKQRRKHRTKRRAQHHRVTRHSRPNFTG